MNEDNTIVFLIVLQTGTSVTKLFPSLVIGAVLPTDLGWQNGVSSHRKRQKDSKKMLTIAPFHQTSSQLNQPTTCGHFSSTAALGVKSQHEFWRV